MGSSLAIIVPATTVAAQREREIRITARSQTLATALLDVAAKGGVELVLATATARTLAAPKIHGRYSLAEALTALLVGSGLTWRRSADGLYVIGTLARAPTESDTPAMPDILVTGRKTQNSDIRRGEDDIQPYKVWTGQDVAQSQSSDIDDFLRNRVMSNAQVGSAKQMALGSNASEVNLRGLGSGQTLVLVDGKRLPSGAAIDLTMYQADLNGIPLSAIERIEVLNSTAGGIYGPGATAGVVNVVLKRNYHGADLGLSYGLSDRGDAETKRLDARIGVSSEDGSTQLMIAASRTWGADLRTGDRNFAVNARALLLQHDATVFARHPPLSASVNIASGTGEALRFDTAYGGASLGASTTSVPASYGGVAADGGALYRSNAGLTDLSLSPDASGAARSLLTRPRLASLLVNLRHSFGDALETYGDLLLLENAGQATFRSGGEMTFWLDADAPGNPFQQPIVVSAPTPVFGATDHYRNRTVRLTTGLILTLPHAWKANVDYSLARTTIKTSSFGVDLDSTASFAATATPLAGQEAILASLLPFTRNYSTQTLRQTNLSDLTLHLAGSIAQLGGGALSLSMLAEDRRENYPAALVLVSGDAPVQRGAFDVGARSVYAELRAPLVDRVHGAAGLRGLELQLAVRYDATRSTIPESLYAAGEPTQRERADAMTYTAGLRVSPVGGVMLRASTALGFLPPLASQIGYYTDSFTSNASLLAQSAVSNLSPVSAGDFYSPIDPKRGGTTIGSEAAYSVLVGGSAHLRPERAQSLSVGMVLTPAVFQGLRLSVDYTRINKRDEIVTFHSIDPGYFLERESELQGRVIRAALTDADRAKGYTGGVVTTIDTSSFNIGRTQIDAVDLQLDYRILTETLGDFRFRAAGNWQPRLTRRNDPESAVVNSAGYADGPLTWRANGGIDWQRGPNDLGLNATYYHGYRTANSTDDAANMAESAVLQGSSRISAQVYFDAYAARRIGLPRGVGGLDELEIRFGVQNLLGHSPPIIVNAASTHYSLYGDPRLRRFELSIIGHY